MVQNRNLPRLFCQTKVKTNSQERKLSLNKKEKDLLLHHPNVYHKKMHEIIRASGSNHNNYDINPGFKDYAINSNLSKLWQLLHKSGYEVVAQFGCLQHK